MYERELARHMLNSGMVGVGDESEHDTIADLAAALADARRRGIEEAAAIAEDRWREWSSAVECEVTCDITACEDIASVIRALINQPEPDDDGQPDEQREWQDYDRDC